LVWEVPSSSIYPTATAPIARSNCQATNCRALQNRITKSHFKGKAAGADLAKNLAKDGIPGIYSKHKKLSINARRMVMSVCVVEGISFLALFSPPPPHEHRLDLADSEELGFLGF
jgi:hypothetical protein